MAHADPIKAAEYRRAYYLKNKEAIKARASAWAKSNPDRAKALYIKSQQKRLASNPELRKKRAEQCSVWHSKNRGRENAWRKKYRRIRFSKDPEFLLRHKIRGAISVSLKSKGLRKSAKYLQLIGCSGPDLRRHIEALWLPGMNWSNYGIRGWHIDHIIPCSKFDLMKPDAQRACFHFTNLQPLWYAQNIAKGNS